MKDLAYILKYYLNVTRKEKKNLIILTIIYILNLSMVIASPFLLEKVLSMLAVILNLEFKYFLFLVMIIFIFLVFLNVIEYFENIIINRLGLKVILEIKKKLFKSHFEYYKSNDSTDTGEIMALIENDAETINHGVITSIIGLMSILFSLLSVMVYLITKSILIFMVVVFITVIASLIYKRFERKILKVEETSKKFYECLSEKQYNSLEYVKEICELDANKFIINKITFLQAISKKLELGIIKLDSWGQLFTRAAVSVNIFVVAIISYFLYAKSILDIPSIIVILTYSQTFIVSCVMIPIQLKNIKVVGISVKRVDDYFKDIDENKKFNIIKPSIVENNEINLNLERVIFNNRKLNFQKKFNFKKGSIYGLVGENGVGKSTILKILNGYNIKYDGSVNYYEGFDWSNCMLLDSNDYRYDASVVRNLCFDSLFSTQLIDKYANKLNFNYEYSKYKNFRSLSSGEAQKIKIIRSLLLEKEVYLFDEIERGLDMKSIENLKEILYNLKKRQAIVIIVTHGRDLLDICDHIYEVESNDD